MAITAEMPLLFDKRADGLHYIQLVLHIQVGCGLVQQQDRRLLGQGSGDEHFLLLAAGELGKIPHGQVLEVQQFQRLGDLVQIKVGNPPTDVRPASP